MFLHEGRVKKLLLDSNFSNSYARCFYFQSFLNMIKTPNHCLNGLTLQDSSPVFLIRTIIDFF